MKHLLITALMVLGLNYQAFAQSDETTETTTTETTTTTTTPPSSDSSMMDRSGTTGTTTGTATDTSTATDTTGTAAGETTGTTEGRENRWGLKKYGAYVEPMLIYTQNESEVKTSAIAGDPEGDVRDASIGARLGLHLGEIFFLAADGRYGKGTFNNSFYEDTDATLFNYGATAGVKTPFYGVQLWGTTVLGGQFDPEAGVQNVDLKFSDATGYRLGAGIHVAAVSLNLEYQTLDYDTTDIESTGNVGNVANVDASQSGLAFSVGFPIEL